MVTKMTNPLSEIQFGRLQESIEWSNRMLEFPKKKRNEAIRELVGKHYSTSGTVKPNPVNFIKLAYCIFIRLLAPRVPRALISTRELELKSTAANLELAVNLIPKEIALQNTMKRAVGEALLSPFGVVKIGLHAVGEMLGHSVGAPFVDLIPLDDLIIDMAAKHIDQIQYIGNEYWLDYKEVMESKWFPKGSTNGLMPDEHTTLGEAGEQRAEGISVDESAQLFKDRIKLRDVWLPSEGIMVTYAVKAKKILKVMDWKGPERGPYSILTFDKVPGNLLGLPPVASWRDLHTLANALYRKLSEQADSQKTVQGFPGGDEEGVKAFQASVDGDGIRWSGGDPKILKAGGVDPNTLAFWLTTKDQGSYFGGNWDASGGLSPQAKTLGQDKLLSEASGAQMRDMAAEVIGFAKEVFGSLAYYEWHDPVRRRKLEKSIPGTDLSIVVPWNRDSRRGKFDVYDLDIDVYSLQDDSPEIKLQKLGMILERFVLPLMPAVERIGGSLDVQKILSDIAKFSDFSEMSEWFQFMEPVDQGAKGEPAKMPANTTRTNVRVNRPGATAEGKSQVLQQALLGGNPQPDEMASIDRQVG